MQGLLAFQRYFQFSGRSARAEYWQFIAIYVGTMLVAYVLDLALFGSNGFPLLLALAFLFFTIPACSVAVRRLHDRGYSGWWLLASIIVSFIYRVLSGASEAALYSTTGDILMFLARGMALVNLGFAIFMLVQLASRGNDFPNRYGPDPLAEPIPSPTIGETFARARGVIGAPAASPAAGTRRSDEDPLKQIERLAKLRDAGLLTEEEFSQQKAAYLGRL